MKPRCPAILVALLALSTFACKGDKKDGPATGTAKPTDSPAAKAAPAALKFIDVPKLGVSLEMPGDAKPDETTPDSYMISRADGTCTVMLD